ncbi:MAG: enoyl-CoA hydratase [Dehalococcoidia bacterium]|nr:enoyl-CoA hydratase [Dehalococcoidia bacterium]
MGSPIYEALRLERAGHVVTITLNRPERLNALNPALTGELHAALDEVAAESDIRAVILTGAGRGFCSGADVGQQLAALEGQRAPSRSGRGVTELGPHLRRIPQPVIAAVNGAATGAGLSLALASDIRVASEEARFSCIFVKRALVPDTGASYMLPRLVGHGIAMEMALTGNIYDAQWALKVGLVNRVVPADRLMEEALALARGIAANPPITVRSTKQLLYQVDQALEEILPQETAANLPSVGTEDRAEAVRSFLEKRPPVYKGR